MGANLLTQIMCSVIYKQIIKIKKIPDTFSLQLKMLIDYE